MTELDIVCFYDCVKCGTQIIVANRFVLSLMKPPILLECSECQSVCKVMEKKRKEN